MLLALTLALAPVSFFFTLIYLKDRIEREPLGWLVFSFVIGILTVLPAALVQHAVGITPDQIFEMQGIEFTIYIFTVIAASEETAKYLALRYLIYPRSVFNERYDGIMYGVSISLGFAAIENVLYVFVFGNHIAWVRMLSAIPLHCLTGIFMGYFIGRAKFEPDVIKRKMDFLKALFSAIFVHGIYDVAALSEGIISWVFLFGILAVCGVVSSKAIKLHQRSSTV